MGAWVIYEPWFTGSHTLCEPCPLGDPKKKASELGSPNTSSPNFSSHIYGSHNFGSHTFLYK